MHDVRDRLSGQQAWGADAGCHAGRVLDREDGEKTGSTIRSVVAATALE
jgi:hypothetical protein